MNITTLEEVANLFKVPVRKIKNWRKTGVMPASCFVKIGGTVYGVEVEINKWISNVIAA